MTAEPTPSVLEHTMALGRASYELERLAKALSLAQSRLAEVEKELSELRNRNER